MHEDTIAPDDSSREEQFQTDRVVIMSIGHGVHDTYTGFLPPLLPAFIEKWALSNTQAGVLTVFLQMPSLLQPFIGHLADRVSLRYFVILAPAVAGITMSCIGVAPGYGVLVLLLALAGINSACLHAVGPAMAGRLSGKNLGRGMGFWMVGGEMGRTLGPLIIVSAVGLLTMKGTTVLMVVGILTSLILYWRLKDVPGRPPDALPGLPWREAIRQVGPVMLPVAGIVVALNFVNVVLTTYLPVFLTQQGSSLWLAGASLSLLQVGGTIGALTAGVASDRLGRRQVLLIATLSTTVLLLAFLSTAGWLQLLVLLVLGFAAISMTPVLMALVQESSPANRALANGLYMALTFCLRAVVVVIVGMIGDTFGLRVAYWSSAVIILISVPLVFLLPSRKL